MYEKITDSMSQYKGKYIDDGIQRKCLDLRSSPNKLISYQKMRILLYRLLPDGKRLPFRIRFVSMDGELIEWERVVCTSRNAKKRTHTFFSTESHNYRTVKDILILMVDDVKIAVD